MRRAHGRNRLNADSVLLFVIVLAIGAFSFAGRGSARDGTAASGASGVAAVGTAPCKGLYYEGVLHEFCACPEAGGLCYNRYTWDGSNMNYDCDNNWSVNPAGGLGAVIFNGTPYCFFTATDGKVQYVTENMDYCSEPTPVNTLGTEWSMSDGNGAVAVVYGGVIWVFTPDWSFYSKDGKHFVQSLWGVADAAQLKYDSTSNLLDAVTFYPPGDNPASVMLVFNWQSPGVESETLTSCVIQPDPYSQPLCAMLDLPWPHADPIPWGPVVEGNLVLGTSGGGLGAAGAKKSSLQFYGLSSGVVSQQGRWEYQPSSDPNYSGTWAFYDATISNDVETMTVFPWYDVVNTAGAMHQSHIMSCVGSQQTIGVAGSDYMIPQYPDNNWGGMEEVTADDIGTELQNLWTLVGIVLGPSSFPMNGAQTACSTPPAALSWVSYGKDVSTSITTESTSTSTISLAVEDKIKGGLGQLSLDLGFAHAWTHSQGTTKTHGISQFYEWGPCAEVGDQGITGWAIFNAPTLWTQWYKLYAHDYDLDTKAGTYLDVDIYTTALGAVVQQTAYFNLADPSQGEYTGLFAGMPVYPNSTDIPGWNTKVPNWDNGGSDWTAVFGKYTSPAMPQLDLGEEDIVSYTQSDTQMTSKGNTNSLSLSAGAKLNIAGWQPSVTVGYSTQYQTTTENETTITEEVQCGLNVPRPTDPQPGWVTSMIVQPYWLQANTAKAPWVPTGYGGNLPWCITWAVENYQTYQGATVGYAAPPASASAFIRSGGEEDDDTYALAGGWMAWLNADGTEAAIPISADQFDPSQGATVSLNGHAFSTNCVRGRWVRKGDVWTYKTRKHVKHDPFTLVMDFGNKTWSFDASSRDLDREMRVADAQVRVQLDLEGLYILSTWLEHDVNSAWRYNGSESPWEPYGVRRITGGYDSETAAGSLRIKGRVTRNLQSFGDIEIRVNGASVRFPLLSVPDFSDQLVNHGRVTYAAEGLSFDIDFATGKWTAVIEGGEFKTDMVPKAGEVHVQVLLGGGPISDQTLLIQEYQTALTYNGHSKGWYGSFTDVPISFWAYEQIEKLHDLGITKGCGEDTYCPNAVVTRAEMAVFIERAINGGSYEPPSATGLFDDVANNYWAADWIEQLYWDQITEGCCYDPLLYCPGYLITRAEMAVFLLRAKHGADYMPPAASGIFTDVPTNHWAADWIEQLHAEGIGAGCSENPLRFCPDDSVNRAEMAAFLVKAFDLE